MDPSQILRGNDVLHFPCLSCLKVYTSALSLISLYCKSSLIKLRLILTINIFISVEKNQENTCLSGDFKPEVEQDYILIKISATFNFSSLVYSTSASGTTFHSAYCTRSTFFCPLLCFSKSSRAVNYNCKLYLSSIYFSSPSAAINYPGPSI